MFTERIEECLSNLTIERAHLAPQMELCHFSRQLRSSFPGHEILPHGFDLLFELSQRPDSCSNIPDTALSWFCVRHCDSFHRAEISGTCVGT
jgi:hypothetical protein